MRNYSKTIGALAAASTLVVGSATANELDGEVNVGYANMYEFRFVDFGNDLFSAGFDLSYETGPVTLSGGAWYGSWARTPGLAGINTANQELDLYAGIGTDLGPVNLEVGYIAYLFPSFSGSNTQELYLAAGADLGWGIGLSSTAFWDFDLLNGLYVDTALTKSFQFNDCLSLDLAVGFGYADGLASQVAAAPRVGTVDSINGYYVSAQLPWEFRSGVTLTPYVKYTDGNSDLVTGPNPGDVGQDFFIAGVKLAVAF
ncbi:TorF family putative porin [Haloferula sp.]|uniref:TorF family putative porin n=1 Tax=Haloferula sp. TaxID=2497595 RepID=UPI003C706233